MRIPGSRARRRGLPREPLGYPELEELVREQFGAALSHLDADPIAQSLEGVLYDGIAFGCGIDADSGIFSGGIRLANGWIMTTLLGEKISHDGDAASVRRNLATIERYCRHRLPDEFFDALDAAAHEPAL